MAWKIFPHGLPEALMDGVWQVSGSLPFPLPRYMTVIRLSDGKLLLYSAVAMNEEGMRALEALGQPSVLVIPHPFHIMDAPFYKARYPHIKVIAAADAAQRLGGRIPVDAAPEAFLPSIGIKHHVARGVKVSEIALELPIPKDGGRALFLCDLFVNGKPGAPFMLRLLGPPGGRGVPRIVKYRQVNNKEAARGYLRELAEVPNLRLLSGTHGPPLQTGCREALLDAAARF